MSRVALFSTTGDSRNGDTRKAQMVFAIRQEFVCSKPFKNLFVNAYNVKLFQRQTTTPPEVFCKKGVLKSFAKFTGKHLCWSLFISGDSSTGDSSTGKKVTLVLVLSCEICELFPCTCLVEHLRMAASVWIFF